jgi:hypothetical protein
MGATTLKLVFAEPFYATPQLTMAISHNVFSPPDYYPNADNVVVCDLTIDCDMRSQIADRVAKAAMKVSGRHVRIRRVRAVDFGTHFFPTECFVIGTAGADPREQYGLTERVDCRIENCIIEQPSLNGLYTNSCLILFGGEEDASDGSRMGWHRACIIRNNYINNEYLDAPVSIAGITLSGGMATVTTHAPHGRLTGDWVVVSGAQVDGSSANTFNGSYSVTKLNDTQFTYTPAAPVPVTNPGGPMWIGRFSSHWISVQQLQRDPSDATGLTAILTSHTPHQRKPDQWVNVWSGSAPIPAGTEPYYGRFPIVGIISPPAHCWCRTQPASRGRRPVSRTPCSLARAPWALPPMAARRRWPKATAFSPARLAAPITIPGAPRTKRIGTITTRTWSPGRINSWAVRVRPSWAR